MSPIDQSRQASIREKESPRLVVVPMSDGSSDNKVTSVPSSTETSAAVLAETDSPNQVLRAKAQSIYNRLVSPELKAGTNITDEVIAEFVDEVRAGTEFHTKESSGNSNLWIIDNLQGGQGPIGNNTLIVRDSKDGLTPLAVTSNSGKKLVIKDFSVAA